jgi:hypothetical protein
MAVAELNSAAASLTSLPTTHGASQQPAKPERSTQRRTSPRAETNQQTTKQTAVEIQHNTEQTDPRRPETQRRDLLANNKPSTRQNQDPTRCKHQRRRLAGEEEGVNTAKPDPDLEVAGRRGIADNSNIRVLFITKWVLISTISFLLCAYTHHKSLLPILLPTTASSCSQPPITSPIRYPLSNLCTCTHLHTPTRRLISIHHSLSSTLTQTPLTLSPLNYLPSKPAPTRAPPRSSLPVHSSSPTNTQKRPPQCPTAHRTLPAPTTPYAPQAQMSPPTDHTQTHKQVRKNCCTHHQGTSTHKNHKSITKLITGLPPANTLHRSEHSHPAPNSHTAPNFYTVPKSYTTPPPTLCTPASNTALRSQLGCPPYTLAPSNPPTPHQHIHNAVTTKTPPYQQSITQMQHPNYKHTPNEHLPPSAKIPHKQLHSPPQQQLPISNRHQPQNKLTHQIRQSHHTQLTPQQKASPNIQAAAQTNQQAPTTYSTTQSHNAETHTKPKLTSTLLHTQAADAALISTITTHNQNHSQNNHATQTRPPNTAPPALPSDTPKLKTESTHAHPRLNPRTPTPRKTPLHQHRAHQPHSNTKPSKSQTATPQTPHPRALNRIDRQHPLHSLHTIHTLDTPYSTPISAPSQHRRIPPHIHQTTTTRFHPAPAMRHRTHESPTQIQTPNSTSRRRSTHAATNFHSLPQHTISSTHSAKPSKTTYTSARHLTRIANPPKTSQTQNCIQIPPPNSSFLTHPPILPPHSFHTATMATNSAAHHTRSLPIQHQDSRTKTKSTNGSTSGGIPTRSHSRAASQHAGRGGKEETAGGAGTRSKSSGRRRALISDYSDDEDRETTAPTPNLPTVLKEKAPLFHDHDIDMQLEDVSPEHGGSSLQLSSFHNEYAAIPNQAAISTTRLDIINLADATSTTSHKSPRKEATSDTQSAKRRRNEAGHHTIPSGANKFQHEKTKEAIPSIDIVSQMWLGFPIHEAIATQQSKDIIHEHRTTEEFTRLGTPTKEIIEFKTLRRAFPHVPQVYYPLERPDAVPGNHLHFTQIPRLEKTDPATGLSEGFHITVRYDSGFKSMSRQEARRGCMERLRQMEIPLGLTYSNPIDIGINAVTKNWAGFIKIHLQHPQRDGIALLQDNWAFVMELEGGERVIGKVEK